MDIKKDISVVGNEIRQTETSVNILVTEEADIRNDLNDLTARIQALANNMGVNVCALNLIDEVSIDEINLLLDEIIIIKDKHRKFPKLSATDVVISNVAGIVAVAIDVFLVGTPEVVKIYKGGENFDGSVLTKAIRKLGEGRLGELCKRLEAICRVPYDISVVKDGMYPQNHRLRSLSHDPFFGLFFSVFDIVMNTTTFIDDSGCLRILPNVSHPNSLTKKILSVFYFIGHIITDVFTARGIPVPGFFLTQFFTSGSSDESIARIAESMYLDGYDLRHFASMSTPVIVKDVIINLYLKLFDSADVYTPLPLAEREKEIVNINLKKEKMHFIANSIAVSGNVAKFFAPPYSCNPCSLNAPEWLAFIKSGANMLRAQFRDSSAETALENRTDIDLMWEALRLNLMMDS